MALAPGSPGASELQPIGERHCTWPFVVASMLPSLKSGGFVARGTILSLRPVSPGWFSILVLTAFVVIGFDRRVVVTTPGRASAKTLVARSTQPLRVPLAGWASENPANFTVPEFPIPALSCHTRRFASAAILHLCCVSFVLECYTLSSRRPGGESGCFLVSGGE
jgi:hypothetical protein